MARLPKPGGDSNSWGSILNDYLAQSLTVSGALKSNTVSTGQIQDGSITAAKLDASTQAAIKATTSVVKSVNNKTPNSSGVVSLTASDVGADAAGAAADVQAGSLQKSSNLGDLSSASTARTNLDLGTAATLNVGTSANTVAAGNQLKLNGNQLFRQEARWRRLGQISTDITSITLQGSSTISPKVQYTAVSGSTINPNVPWDWGQGLDQSIASGVWSYTATPKGLTNRSIRFMTDSPEVEFYLWNYLGYMGFELFIDNAPATASATLITSAQWVHVSLPSSKTRLIEIRTNAAFWGISISATYKAWKPTPLQSPRLLVIGDSYVAGTVCNGSTYDVNQRGIYQGMEDYLNIEDVWIDGIGGTGYIQRTSGLGAPNNNYLDRLPDHIRIAPDYLVVHGGGANDFYHGLSLSSVQAQVISYFTQARTALPNTTLIFVEGFTPPTFSFNSSYVTLSANLKSALASTNVYYVNVATTDPWIYGTGYTPGHTTGNGNTDRYVGFDAAHLTIDGNLYIKIRMAAALQSIISGNATPNV